MGPWNTEQINRARRVPFSAVLNFLGAYYKRDREYEPLDPTTKSIRVQVELPSVFRLPTDGFHATRFS